MDHVFPLSRSNEIFIFHTSSDTNNSSTTKREFHHNLVTLPSPHSTTAKDFSPIVFIVSHCCNLFLLSHSNIFEFNIAFPLSSTTKESLGVEEKYELYKLIIIIHIIDIIIKIINLFPVFFIFIII